MTPSDRSARRVGPLSSGVLPPVVVPARSVTGRSRSLVVIAQAGLARVVLAYRGRGVAALSPADALRVWATLTCPRPTVAIEVSVLGRDRSTRVLRTTVRQDSAALSLLGPGGPLLRWEFAARTPLAEALHHAAGHLDPTATARATTTAPTARPPDPAARTGGDLS